MNKNILRTRRLKIYDKGNNESYNDKNYGT